MGVWVGVGRLSPRRRGGGLRRAALSTHHPSRLPVKHLPDRDFSISCSRVLSTDQLSTCRIHVRAWDPAASKKDVTPTVWSWWGGQ